MAGARKIAFSVLVENGVYGGTYAAPAAAEIVNAAQAESGADPAMSLFSEIEKTIERGFRNWTERVFGPAESDELLLVHRAILEEIEGKVQTVARGKRVFPYTRADGDAGLAGRRPARAVPGGLRRRTAAWKTICARRCEAPAARCRAASRVEVRDRRRRAPRAFEIEYGVSCPEPAQRRRPSSRPRPAPPARWWWCTGKADAGRVHRWTRPRTNIGRMAELTDSEQRVVRRNDVVFEEGGDEANATVSRAPRAHPPGGTASTASATTRANSARASFATAAPSKCPPGTAAASGCGPATRSTWDAPACGSSGSRVR